ncbi:MAG: metallophosphoesterase, partial [Candidatus Neomarinimicrobiota bacterium]
TLGLEGPWPVVLWAVLVTLSILPIVPLLLRFLGIENRFTDILSWIGYTSLGFFSLTFGVVLLRDAGLVLWAAGAKLLAWVRAGQSQAPQLAAGFDPGRRQFIITAMNLGLVGLTSGLSTYGLFQARRKATVMGTNIPLRELPPQLAGLRIVQISDLHVGPTVKRGHVQRTVDQVKELNPDLIVLTGDLVDGSVSFLSDDVAPLEELEAPLGKFFVTGNHEYYSGVDHWLVEVDRIGFTCLVNEHRTLDVRGAPLVVAGVTDLHANQVTPAHATDPDAALAGAPAGAFKLLLAHQPGSIYDARRLGVHLQLSGHTHGGQYIPFHFAVAAAHPYLAGLHDHDGTWIYVNRGTGYWGPPLRLGVPSEISVLTLDRAPDEPTRTNERRPS